MTSLVHRIWLLVIISSSILAFGQSGSPQAALEELTTADDVSTALRHLPVSVGRAIARMSAAERAGIEKELLFRNQMKAEGVELQKGSDDDTWELTTPNYDNPDSKAATRKKILITIKSAMENGDDALLLIEGEEESAKSSDETPREPHERESALVRMRFEDGDWRITDIGAVQQMSVEDLVLKKVGHSESSAASAVGTLRTLTTAIISYQAAYENVGLPSSIAALSCPSDENCNDATAEHAGLLDSSFRALPLIRSGYEFQYTRISSDRYTITATPVGRDSTQSRSFFTDESGVIRSTQESRAATAQDPPLQ